MIEFTDEELSGWLSSIARTPRLKKRLPSNMPEKVEAARKHRALLEERHQYFLEAAGAKHNGMSVAEAKKYVRARAASSLRQSFEVLEQALSQAGKVAEKVDVALELVKRAVGPHAVPNSITDAKQLTELAPVDAIDTFLKPMGRVSATRNSSKPCSGCSVRRSTASRSRKSWRRSLRPRSGRRCNDRRLARWCDPAAS